MGDADKIPDTSKFELFLAGAKAFIAGMPLPYVAGSIAEVVGYIGQRHISERQRRFLESVLRRLEEMSKRIDGLPSRLATDEAFYSTLYYALDAVRATHDKEKTDAFANVVLNAATPNAPEEYLQHTFVRYVHELTAWHLALLACIADPIAWAEARQIPVYVKDINPGSLFEAATREQLHPRGLHDVLLQDLYTRGLAANNANPYAMLNPPSDQIVPHITELGKLFLAFLTPPDEDTEINPRDA